MPSSKLTSLPTGWLWGLLLVSIGSVVRSAEPEFPGAPTDWHGFARYDFVVQDYPVTVVAPRTPLAGRPWVWHGEFFGHKPAPDQALLARGFHVAYVSVPDRYGSPRAVQAWDTVYDELTTRYRLAHQVALVGLSRGGLYCYNWAAAHPDRVACIYGDAPVCDIKSWPGGKGKGAGSEADWLRLQKEYGFASETEALQFLGNPVDQLRPLAAAGIPLLHVYGDADEVVPWDENTGSLATRYRELGGEITLIAKPGIGHHPHGLDDPTPIVEFLAKHSPGAPESYVAAVWQPLWPTPTADATGHTDRQTTWRHETVLFLQENATQPPAARLLFPPTQIRRLVTTSGDLEYVRDQDFVWNGSTQRLELTPHSRIRYLDQETLYPRADAETPQIARQAGDRSRGIYFDNGSAYHRLQVVVEYDARSAEWQGPIPTLATGRLPRTVNKLRHGAPLRMFVLGDSISAGYNASKFTQAAPYCPAYDELLTLALAQRTGSSITRRNFAVGGWSAAQGLEHARSQDWATLRPDLVLIAFGMNDVFQRDPQQYQQRVAEIRATIREQAPDCEFLLLAPMLGNQAWGMPMEQFPAYRDALLALAESHTEIVDMTNIWAEILRHKSFYDLCGNGVNHPNDWGHLLYAQAIAHLFRPQ